jgi:hypothetical protein
MLHKASIGLFAVSLVGALFFSGCGSSESQSLSLTFVPQETAVYKSTTDVIKDYRFEQPVLGKLTEQQTKNTVVMEYTQDVQRVDESGNATLKITIDQLSVEAINKNEPQLSFDSRNEADKNAPLAKLIGQSYTIRMTPLGKVEVLETQGANAAVTGAYEKKVAQSILDPKSIIGRHEIPGMPSEPATKLKAKRSWKHVVPSPPGLLSPKSYEKVYTVTDVKDNIAQIQMVGTESAQSATGGLPSAGGMGAFAKMFDNTDDYTGSMQIHTATGQVVNLEETLISTYLAQEMPENGDPAKGPDTLLMRFTNRIKLEKLN